MGWIPANKMMMTPHSFSWISFDCFNALIDDFIQGGDESGISPIIHIPAEAGLYESPSTFLEAYNHWRCRQWHGDECPEILLDDRLRVLLAGRASNPVIEEVVNRMMAVYAEEYHKTVRVTPGTESMLNHWRGRESITLTGRLTALIVRYRMISLQDNAYDENNESIQATCHDEF